MHSLVIVGAVAGGLGTSICVWAGSMKSKADRAQASRKAEEKVRGRKLHRWYLSGVISGGLLATVGTLLMFYGGEVQSRLQAADFDLKLTQERAESARSALRVNEKLEAVMAALGAAKKETSKTLTEEKIKMIQNDFIEWATEFTNTRSAKQKAIDAARLEAIQKEIQITEQSRPLFTFTIRFIQEAIKAYMAKTGEKINADIPELPDNFYGSDANRLERVFQFKGDASWVMVIEADRPATTRTSPHLAFTIGRKNGSAGVVRLAPNFETNKLVIEAFGNLPFPEPSGHNEFELSQYEITIRSVFQKLLEAQLLDGP